MTEYEKLRSAIDSRAATDPKLRAILRRIDKGTATFADTAEYSRICAEIMGRELSGAVLELSDREGVCTQLLRDGYDDINDICGTVQRSLDEKQGLHIAPQKAAFPAERVRQIAHSLVDPTVPDETIQRRAGKSVGNVYFSFHDDYIKENAKFRNDAGLKCYITRIVSAGACKWCAEVAGKFRFGDQPEDIFRRHDSCDCTILYDDQVLRGKIDGEGKSTKTWEEIGEVPADFAPTVFTPEQAEQLQNERLAGYRGLTSGTGNGTIRLGINLFDKSDPIYVEAFSIEEEPGFKDVMLHGSSSSVQIIRNGKPVNLSPEEFAVVLRQNGYAGGDIRLASCETGKGENSFAQQLSKTLGVRVKAPDADVYYAPSEGTLFVGDPYINTGKWRLFDNGVEVND